MRELVRDAALLLATMLLLGTASNLVPGRRLAWWGKGHEPPAAGKDYQLVDAGSADSMRISLPGVVFLDDRSAGEFAAGHVPGAEPISYTDLARQLTPDRLARLRSADAVILYGASEETDIEQLLAQELRRRGLAPPYVLAGGFAAWAGAGLPLERREGP
ncbi:MAG TPA: rhodanese-like domain-containing protein [Thermoanaerobaculaceae bacterium]|nr:rhodanese-like domain-containing protein [Thermoanaerobaculaceae bacterium]